jgi:hypothetical protein
VTRQRAARLKVLAIDVGGSHVKILATGQKQKREIVSGPRMTARQMVSRVKKLSEGWAYEVVSVGFPGPVLHNRPVAEPYNLGRGWMGFDFASAFDLPVRVPYVEQHVQGDPAAPQNLCRGRGAHQFEDREQSRARNPSCPLTRAPALQRVRRGFTLRLAVRAAHWHLTESRVLANGRFAPIAAIRGKSVFDRYFENVENRTAPKISRRLILSRLDRRTLLCADT